MQLHRVSDGLSCVADLLGDPWDTSIILWTRAEPTDTYRIDVPVCVKYKVWSSEDGTGDCVSSGWALTGEDVDWTVKVSRECTGTVDY